MGAKVCHRLQIAHHHDRVFPANLQHRFRKECFVAATKNVRPAGDCRLKNGIIVRIRNYSRKGGRNLCDFRDVAQALKISRQPVIPAGPALRKPGIREHFFELVQNMV